MKDVELYQQLLGLEHPWKVNDVQIDHQEKHVLITVGFKEKEFWACPQCHQRAHIHEWETRRWRHLDSCQYRTLIEAQVPRVKCEEHGSLTVAVPWAERYGRFTKLFERFAIDVLQECSVKGACKILGITWDEADGIKQRAVRRGLLRKEPQVMPHLCVDEKSYGHGHQYATIVADVRAGQPVRVEYIEQGRSKESLDGFWQGLTAEQVAGVEGVAMDLLDAYLVSTQEHLPEADQKISHDPYHLVRHMNHALNKVRRRECRELDERQNKAQKDALKGSRYAWLYGWENLKEYYQPLLQKLTKMNLKTSLAAEGGDAMVLVVRRSGGSPGFLQALVCLGDPQPVGSGKKSGADDETPH